MNGDSNPATSVRARVAEILGVNADEIAESGEPGGSCDSSNCGEENARPALASSIV